MQVKVDGESIAFRSRTLSREKMMEESRRKRARWRGKNYERPVAKLIKGKVVYLGMPKGMF